MLKSALGLTVFALGILLATCDWDSRDSYGNDEDLTLQSVFKKCRSATEASKTAYQAFKLLKIPRNREGRCFVKCVVAKSDRLPRKAQRIVDKFLRKTKFNKYYGKMRCPEIDESGGGRGGSYDSQYGSDYDDRNNYRGTRGRGAPNSEYVDDAYGGGDDYNERAKKKPAKAGSPLGKSGKGKLTGRQPK